MSWYLIVILWLCAAASLLYWIAGRAGIRRFHASVFAASVVLAFGLGWAVHGRSRPDIVASTAAPARTTAPAPLPTADAAVFSESLAGLRFPAHVPAHRIVTGSIIVENRSPHTWLAHNAVPILLGYKVLDAAGTAVREGRSATHMDFPPGARRTISFTVDTPGTPGRYTLKLDMVYEGFAWFESSLNKPATQAITVD